MVLAVVFIVAGFAVPTVKQSLINYRLRGAVASATWAIQSTRFQALMAGYSYNVTFSGGAGGVNPQYQIASNPTGAGFSNVGSAVPLSGSAVTLNQTTVLKFDPNGVVTATTGALNNLQITFSGLTKTISVSNYGNVSVN